MIFYVGCGLGFGLGVVEVEGDWARWRETFGAEVGRGWWRWRWMGGGGA